MTEERIKGISPKKRIFLSYGRDEHVSFALRLKNDLIARRYDVWFDADRIKPGADWEQYIEDGLAWASESPDGQLILLMTPHSVRRPDGFCLNELARAIQLNMKVIPVMLSWCEPPLSICRIQWLDMQDCLPVDRSPGPYEEKLKALLEVIEHGTESVAGAQARLAGALKPLSFDSEIKYNLHRFIGRTWVTEAIEEWLNDSDAQRVFWITGRPGVGKTSISAWLCANWREVAAFHFCRHDNVQKIDPRRCIMSLAYQLSTQLPEYERRLARMSLEDLSGLNARALFDKLIVQPLSRDFPRPRQAMVIVIDALDEATVDGKNDLAGFIASELERTPQWLRLIVTSRPEPEVAGALQAYRQFAIETGDVRNEDDVEEFLARELGEGVPADTIKKVAAKCNGLFIYAEWVVKEIKYGRLSLDNIDDFPKGLGGIYLRFFERQFPDIRAWEARIRPVLEIMAASFEPLSLRSIAAIFKWNVHEERELKLSLGSLFIANSDGVRPFHASVMEWLTDEKKDDRYFVSAGEGHRILGTYLLEHYKKGKPAWNRPMMKYLPMHLCLADMAYEAEEVLRNMDFVSREWSLDRFNVMRWWAVAEEHDGLYMTDMLKGMIENPPGYDERRLEVAASMLMSSFRVAESCRIYEHLADRYRSAGRHDELREVLSKQVSLLVTMSDHERAVPLLEELERKCRESGDLGCLQQALQSRAEYLWTRNEFDEALSILREQERICRETDNYEGLCACLNEQSTIQRVKGNVGAGMALLKEQEGICRSIGNIDGVKESLSNQGIVMKALGELDAAVKLFKEVEALSRKTNDKKLLCESMIGISTIDIWRGEYDRALEALKKAEMLCRELNYKWYLWDVLYEQSLCLRQKGDLDAAGRIVGEAMQICRDIDNPFGIQFCMGQQAAILRLRGDLDGALAVHREQERICREIGHKRDLAVSLNNQAIILRMGGAVDDALALHGEAEKAFREIGYKYGLQECLGEKAMALSAKGDFEGALTALKEQRAYCKDMALKPDLIRCLEQMSGVLHALEDRKAPVKELELSGAKKGAK
ncbi:hypothetical protein MCP_2385 [Methanocella paludicola SANAE]|uniref:TIR domain-containing protein n=1 Tax=Methanocella paludicola (strain DSM 17711 / JCM 13418 / NBRC 101707 / SANAE) TaxID=304371 RepID=D1Z185_METPS|nr:TIR domain-containing protein [Methanocella paludicola]BAI62457.1 hypothetical protein MCP_2385 [Methanocella paludicola SANAE]